MWYIRHFFCFCWKKHIILFALSNKGTDWLAPQVVAADHWALMHVL